MLPSHGMTGARDIHAPWNMPFITFGECSVLTAQQVATFLRSLPHTPSRAVRNPRTACAGSREPENDTTSLAVLTHSCSRYDRCATASAVLPLSYQVLHIRWPTKSAKQTDGCQPIPCNRRLSLIFGCSRLHPYISNLVKAGRSR